MRTRNLIAAACLVAGLSSTAEAEPEKLKIPKSVVATAFNAVFASTKVHIDNLGAKNGTSWLEEDSYVLLPSGKKLPFLLGEHERKIGELRYSKHYVDDMSTDKIQATISGDKLKVDAYFESQGEELQGKCIRKHAGKWEECTLGMERSIDLNHSILSMSFVPVAHEGSISYADAEVSFKTDVHINSALCQLFSGICAAIEDKIEEELSASVETAAADALERDDVRSHVGIALRKVPVLRDLLQDRKVLAVESKGDAFVVTLDRS
jgi:hypothetical protein